jgi:hypothetical protein
MTNGDSGPQGGFSVTGAANIEAYTLIGLRIRLKRRALGGLEMFSRGPSVLQQVNYVMGTRYRTARTAYPKFDTWLVAKYPGRVESVPLDTDKEKQ